MIGSLGHSRHTYRIPAAASRLALVAGALALLGGCGTLGSGTIVAARTPVNEAVANTARQQTLMNIVRVYHNEAPLILDLVEADEAVSFGGSATGGVAGIGAVQGTSGGTLAGRTGSAGAIVSASDAVTNRYVPLQGQALINQLSNPITVETVNALYDSDWPLQSILDFAYDRITPSENDTRLAIDLLTLLDNNNAISLATAKSGFSKDDLSQKSLKTGNVTINTQSNSAGGGDTLNIYKSPPSMYKTDPRRGDSNTAWNLLSALYHGTQPDGSGHILNFDNHFLPFIELRSSPRTHLNHVNLIQSSGLYLGPIARTRTAIGILKYIVTQPKVAFITPLEYTTIRKDPWNGEARLKACGSADYYILDPAKPLESQKNDPEIYFDANFDRNFTNNFDKLSDLIRSISGKSPFCPFEYVLKHQEFEIDRESLGSFAIALGQLERNMLIVRSDSPIAGAQTSWSDGQVSYSIMPDDLISQRNLMLVSQFLTIQSTSSPTPSLTTISPNGR